MQNLQNSRVKSNFHNLTIQDPLGLNSKAGAWFRGRIKDRGQYSRSTGAIAWLCEQMKPVSHSVDKNGKREYTPPNPADAPEFVDYLNAKSNLKKPKYFNRQEAVTKQLDLYLKLVLKDVKAGKVRLVEYSCTNELLTVKIERI